MAARRRFNRDERDVLASGQFTARWLNGSWWRDARVTDADVKTDSIGLQYVEAVDDSPTTPRVSRGQEVRLYPGQSKFLRRYPAMTRRELGDLLVVLMKVQVDEANAYADSLDLRADGSSATLFNGSHAVTGNQDGTFDVRETR